MEKDKKSSEKNHPQQRPEDAKKQNAQQEREYREQKSGKIGKLPDQPTNEEAIEEYEDIKSDEKKGDRKD